VLSHTFLSGKKFGRNAGDAPEYDVFLSYRVDSDLMHAEMVYRELTEKKGLKVWWDKRSLPPGKNWEEGFCNGLVNAATFVCLLSREAINSPTVARRNLANLTTRSPCDNVVLEWRLATELQELGYIGGILPLLIGDCDPTTSQYSHYFRSGCHPALANDVAVDSIECKLREHLERVGMGCPLSNNVSIKCLLNTISASHGFFIEGDLAQQIKDSGDAIVDMVAQARRDLM
jgi:hypothetical protein